MKLKEAIKMFISFASKQNKAENRWFNFALKQNEKTGSESKQNEKFQKAEQSEKEQF